MFSSLTPSFPIYRDSGLAGLLMGIFYILKWEQEHANHTINLLLNIYIFSLITLQFSNLYNYCKELGRLHTFIHCCYTNSVAAKSYSIFTLLRV